MIDDSDLKTVVRPSVTDETRDEPCVTINYSRLDGVFRRRLSGTIVSEIGHTLVHIHYSILRDSFLKG